MILPNPQEALVRANMVTQVKALVNQGNCYIAASTTAVSKQASDHMYQQGILSLNKAEDIRKTFWQQFPNALIPQSFHWMSRNGF